MRINGKVYFDPWVGDNYESGIKGDKILVIGLQHWCDPTYWGCCYEDPHECLDQRDSTCTVWNAECYRPKDPDKNLNENDKKPSGWEYLGKDIMPNCPIEKCKDRNKCTNTESDAPRFRYLHCETKISVYNHINDQERAQRASIFGAVLTALGELYFDFKNNKKKCWNSIAFTNFIQHYTKIDNKNPNRIDINKELTEVLSEKNSVALQHHIDNLEPNVIIALKIDKITSLIKAIYRNKYVECKNISIMTPMGGTFTFLVFAEKDSFLYKKIENDLRCFVNNYIIENLQVDMDAKDLKIDKNDIKRKIQALAVFIKEQKGGKGKQLVNYRDNILKNENIHESIRRIFYKDYTKQNCSMFKDIGRSKVKDLLNNEIERIRVAYEGKAKEEEKVS